VTPPVEVGSSLDDSDRALCACLGNWLDAQRVLGLFALLLILIGALVLLADRETIATTFAGGALLLALPERYCAVRLAFDRDLFDALGRGTLDAKSMDAALERLRLRRNAGVPRGLDQRVDGTLRLQRTYLLVLLAQSVCVGAALLGIKL
jgi:hypothetical protein